MDVEHTTIVINLQKTRSSTTFLLMCNLKFTEPIKHKIIDICLKELTGAILYPKQDNCLQQIQLIKSIPELITIWKIKRNSSTAISGKIEILENKDLHYEKEFSFM